MVYKKSSQGKKRTLHGISGHSQKKIRKDLYDQDYINKLTDKEKKFLSKFNMEYNQADFSSPGKDLHRTKKDRKICTDRNNARNRDIYARSKARNALISTDDLYSNDDSYDPETMLIEKLDSEDNS